MKCKFLGVEAREYVNRNTGEKGTEYVLQLHDGESAKLIRIPVERYREFQSVQPMSDVVVHFAFADGRFGQHFPAIAKLEPVRETAKAS